MFGGKQRSAWLTRHQLEILDAIRQHGRRGVLVWHTDISLSTLRSLAKRGFVDTRSRGRIVVTRAGKKRLTQPWPASQPTGDQKAAQGIQESSVARIGPERSDEG